MATSEELKAALKTQGKRARRLLAVVPLDQGDWKPHEKSMSLYKLAAHVATLPNFLHLIVSTTDYEYDPASFPKFTAQTNAEFIAALDTGLEQVKTTLDTLQPEDLETHWKFSYQGQVFTDLPRRQVFVTELGHSAHHCGQLTVYLRMLDVPLPGLFGPTADSPA